MHNTFINTPSYEDLIRSRFWNNFIAHNKDTLDYFYNKILTPFHRSRVTLDDWYLFAYNQTSTDGIKRYN
jgi:hypothetical protein